MIYFAYSPVFSGTELEGELKRVLRRMGYSIVCPKEKNIPMERMVDKCTATIVYEPGMDGETLDAISYTLSSPHKPVWAIRANEGVYILKRIYNVEQLAPEEYSLL